MMYLSGGNVASFVLVVSDGQFQDVAYTSIRREVHWCNNQ